MTTKPDSVDHNSPDGGRESAKTMPSRLLRLPEVVARVGLCRSTIYKRMSDGLFPKCRSLGPKCSVWVESEIDAWIDDVVRSERQVDQ